MDNLDQIFLLLLTVVPALSILLLFVFLDKFVEPKKYIIATFALGTLIIGPLYMFDDFVFLIKGSEIEYSPFTRAFFSAAFLEEVLKFCVLFFFCVRLTHFNEPMDGIVYGTVASLGFALYENIFYVYGAENFSESLSIAYVRALTAVPSHAFGGVIMGFFIGKHYFRKHENKINIYLALIVPIILHGFYDWTLMEEKINFNFMWIVMAVEIFLVIYLYKDLKKEQLLKKHEAERKKI